MVANVSNTVGLGPGSISGALGYRRELGGQRRRCVVYGACSAAGAIVGGILLLNLPGTVFATLVPGLILLACAMVVVQPWLVRRLADVQPGRLRGAGLIGVFLTGVYGGYFGAAQGVILIALLGIVIDDSLQRLNALKNVLAGVANTVAAILFICVSHVAWGAALLIAGGSIIGAQLGARYGRRISPLVLRAVIVVVGTAVAIVLLARD